VRRRRMVLPLPVDGIDLTPAYSQQPPTTCPWARNMVAFDGGQGRLLVARRPSFDLSTSSGTPPSNINEVDRTSLFGTTYAVNFSNSGAGTSPTSQTCITTYRGRIVQAGGSPTGSWYMSKVGDANDWEYGTRIPDDPSQAVSSTTASGIGKCPDPIRVMVAVGDAMLYFFCDDSIYVLRGDPVRGGRIDKVSSSTGIVGKYAWCMDDAQTIYFFGSGGVYRMPAGGVPELISQRVGPVFEMASSVQRLMWDPYWGHLYVLLATGYVLNPNNQTAEHYTELTKQCWVWVRKNNSWWRWTNCPQGTADAYHYLPTNVTTPAAKRLVWVTLSGGTYYSWKLRTLSGPDTLPTPDDDDTAGAATTDVHSALYLAPVTPAGMQTPPVLTRLSVQLAYAGFDASSGDGNPNNPTWPMGDSLVAQVRVGRTPEEAFRAKRVAAARTWAKSGRKIDLTQRVRGNSFALKLLTTTDDPYWALEAAEAEFEYLDTVQDGGTS
jgi:hypothetical protein